MENKELLIVVKKTFRVSNWFLFASVNPSLFYYPSIRLVVRARFEKV